MPRTTLCAVCNGHGATNYKLSLPFYMPELARQSSVSAATIDLCDACWTRLTNKRTLTLEGVHQRIAQRRERILANAAAEAEQQTRTGW